MTDAEFKVDDEVYVSEGEDLDIEAYKIRAVFFDAEGVEYRFWGRPPVRGSQGLHQDPAAWKRALLEELRLGYEQASDAVMKMTEKAPLLSSGKGIKRESLRFKPGEKVYFPWAHGTVIFGAPVESVKVEGDRVEYEIGPPHGRRLLDDDVFSTCEECAEVLLKRFEDKQKFERERFLKGIEGGEAKIQKPVKGECDCE